MNLIQCISEALRKANHPHPTHWETELMRPGLAQSSTEEQRHFISGYWRIKVGLCNADSTTERFCLHGGGDDKTYIKNFIAYVVPFIVHNKLGYPK